MAGEVLPDAVNADSSHEVVVPMRHELIFVDGTPLMLDVDVVTVEIRAELSNQALALATVAASEIGGSLELVELTSDEAEIVAVLERAPDSLLSVEDVRYSLINRRIPAILSYPEGQRSTFTRVQNRLIRDHLDSLPQ